MPRVCVGLPVMAGDDVGAGRRAAAAAYERYGRLTNYRRILDIEGVEGPAEVALVGNEAALAEQLSELAAAGATDFIANIFTAEEGDAAAAARFGGAHLCGAAKPGGQNLTGRRRVESG